MDGHLQRGILFRRSLGALLTVAVVATAAVPATAAAGQVTGLDEQRGRVAVAQPAPAFESYVWPLRTGTRVSHGFDPPRRPWLPGHRGVDLVGSSGAEVRAAGPGVVRFAGPVGGRDAVSVDHAHGLRTTYQPVDPAVAAGDRVVAGSSLGTLAPGHAGCPVLACLHWGLRRGDLYLDPLSLLGLGGVRLLPVPHPDRRTADDHIHRVDGVPARPIPQPSMIRLSSTPAPSVHILISVPARGPSAPARLGP